MTKVFFINKEAENEVESLSSDLRKKLEKVLLLMKALGTVYIGMPHIKPLKKNIWEIRLNGKDNIARSIFIKSDGISITILRTFIKKTQKTPTREINIAMRRLKNDKC